jgi:tellurite resistance protein TehA-like permease
MFIGLLAVAFLIAVGVSTIAAIVFIRPLRRIMQRIVPDEISGAWVRYLMFAIYVVGVGGGVNVRQIERYINPGAQGQVLELTRERWVVEVYSSVIGALGAIAWMLLVFFVLALVAYVLVRAFELKRREQPLESAAPHQAARPSP